MQVLHLHWLTPTQPGQHGRFFLWAETMLANQPSRDRRKKIGLIELLELCPPLDETLENLRSDLTRLRRYIGEFANFP